MIRRAAPLARAATPALLTLALLICPPPRAHAGDAPPPTPMANRLTHVEAIRQGTHLADGA